jgi:hypothetical protein
MGERPKDKPTRPAVVDVFVDEFDAHAIHRLKRSNPALELTQTRRR